MIGELYIGDIKSHKYSDNRCITVISKKLNQAWSFQLQRGYAERNGDLLGLHSGTTTHWTLRVDEFRMTCKAENIACLNIVWWQNEWVLLTTFLSPQGKELKNRITKRCLEIKDKSLLVVMLWPKMGNAKTYKTFLKCFCVWSQQEVHFSAHRSVDSNTWMCERLRL